MDMVFPGGPKKAGKGQKKGRNHGTQNKKLWLTTEEA